MSDALSPAALFDLDGFEHAVLFDGCRFAWEALPRIADYLREHAAGAAIDPTARVADGAHLEGPVVVGPGARIEAGAYVRGPAIIGPESEVRFGAYVRGNVILGRKCVVGNSSELKATVLFDGANAPHYNYCGDSILGRGVNLGAGTKLSNLRLDGSNIVLRVDGERLDTGLRKFGGILGDGTQTGCNSVLNPGTVAGRNALVWPCAVATGWLPAGSVVRPAPPH